MNKHNSVAGSDFFANHRVPEDFGWRRKAALDEPGREAWQLPDGTLLLLDPTGRSDSLVRAQSGPAARDGDGEAPVLLGPIQAIGRRPLRRAG